MSEQGKNNLTNDDRTVNNEMQKFSGGFHLDKAEAAKAYFRDHLQDAIASHSKLKTTDTKVNDGQATEEDIELLAQVHAANKTRACSTPSAVE